MDRQVIIKDYQEVSAEDFMNIQGHVRSGVDMLVKHAIHDGQVYGGFEVAKDGSFGITIGEGVYFNAGKTYMRRAPMSLDLVQHQPVANKKMVAIVVWGGDVEQEPVYRDFVVNLETEETEARQINIQSARVAHLAAIGGMESGDPQPPNIPLDRIAVAFVILSPTGIESISANVDDDLSPTKKNDIRLTLVEQFQAEASPRIQTLGSDVANLANKSRGLVTNADLFGIAGDVARLKERFGLPDDYSDYGADHFLNGDESDTQNAEWMARLEEGVRFSPENEGISELGVFSSIDPHITQINGMILPKYKSLLRFSVSGYVDDLSISQYSQTGYEMVQKTMSRERVRWGGTYEYCTNSQWWREGNYDSVTGVFTRNGESFQVLSGDVNTNHRWIRLRQFWRDTYEEPYWSVVETNYTLNGAQVAQTFLNTQEGWLTGIDLNFTKRGTSGDVHVLVTEVTPSGSPDPKKVIARKTLTFLKLKLFPEKTTVNLTPTYLKAGGRYAVVLITQGNHFVAMADGGRYLSGTFFYSTDGAYYEGDLTKDMMFGLRFAKFDSSRVVVNMKSLQLNGGIAGIDIMAPMVSPDACELTYEVQLPTGWVSISSVSPSKLAGLPPNLPFRIVFQGTPDLHAGLFLTGSQVKLQRPRTYFRHISTSRILAAASDRVRIEWQLGNWNGSRHTFTAKLKTPHGDEEPDIVEDTPLPEDRIKRVMTFNLSQLAPSFVIEAEGTTTTALDVFHVEERVDIEL